MKGLNATMTVLFLIFQSWVWGQGGYTLDCHLENEAFQTNEELVYKLYYNLDFIWIPAGEVTFRMKEDSTTYTIMAEGVTYPSYEWFYKVDDEYRTRLDKKTLLPLVAERRLAEGGYRLYEKLIFDHDNGTTEVFRGRDKTSTTNRGVYDMTSCAADIVGMMYRLRNVDKSQLQKHKGMPVSFFMDTKEYNVYMKYLGEERIRVRGLGRYETLKVRPNLISGEVFKEGDEMTAWVSNDGNRVPLMIESPLTVGSVKAVLKTYRGLKYPLGE